MKCIKCGCEFNEGIFCPECGTKCEETSNEFNQSSPIIEDTISPTSASSIESTNSQSTIPRNRPTSSPNVVKQDDKNPSSGKATLSLVFGVISIISFGILIIPEILGIVFSLKGKDSSGKMYGKAKAGLILSIISSSFVALCIFILIITPSSNSNNVNNDSTTSTDESVAESEIGSEGSNTSDDSQNEKKGIKIDLKDDTINTSMVYLYINYEAGIIPDSKNKYDATVYLDNEEIGTIHKGDERMFFGMVTAGKHTMKIKGKKAKKATLKFEVQGIQDDFLVNNENNHRCFDCERFYYSYDKNGKTEVMEKPKVKTYLGGGTSTEVSLSDYAYIPTKYEKKQNFNYIDITKVVDIDNITDVLTFFKDNYGIELQKVADEDGNTYYVSEDHTLLLDYLDDSVNNGAREFMYILYERNSDTQWYAHGYYPGMTHEDCLGVSGISTDDEVLNLMISQMNSPNEENFDHREIDGTELYFNSYHMKSDRINYMGLYSTFYTESYNNDDFIDDEDTYEDEDSYDDEAEEYDDEAEEYDDEDIYDDSEEENSTDNSSEESDSQIDNYDILYTVTVTASDGYVNIREKPDTSSSIIGTAPTGEELAVYKEDGKWLYTTYYATEGWIASSQVSKNSNETSNDYILPNSQTKALTESDLEDLSEDECRLARNEIYARHGKIFQSEDLQKYFGSKYWYVTDEGFDESNLSQIEKDNIKAIVAYEKKMGYNQN